MPPGVSISSATSAPTATTAPAPATPQQSGSSWGFAQVLSALNPLQYLPVVGTIYRAVTGDRIPEGLQIAGSLAVGVALSGPIGLVTGIAAIIAEKATGIDPDKIAHRVAVSLGISSDPLPAHAVAQASGQQPHQDPKLASVGDPSVALSMTETLNQHELDRLHAATLAYAKAAALG